MFFLFAAHPKTVSYAAPNGTALALFTANAGFSALIERPNEAECKE